MPHYGLNDGVCAAVVKSVHASIDEGAESAPPKRSGAAPAGADVVLHVKTVLNHVGVWPDCLVRVARKTAVPVLEKSCRVCEVVLACRPARTVTVGTADLGEERLSGSPAKFRV